MGVARATVIEPAYAVGVRRRKGRVSVVRGEVGLYTLDTIAGYNEPDSGITLKASVGEMRLFDEIPLEKRPHRVIQATQSAFDFLNKSAWTIMYDARQRSEDWFARYSEMQSAEQAHELRSRFRSRSKETHEGAFLELFTHELFCRRGWSITAIPQRSSEGVRTPDFCVEYKGQKAYIEVTHKGQAPIGQNTVQAFLDQLNGHKVVGWYAVFVSSGTLQRYLGKDKVMKVVNFAKSLPYPPNEATPRWSIDGPSVHVCDGDWRGEFTFHPLRRPDKALNRFVAIESPHKATIESVDADAKYASQIRDIIAEKSKRYDVEYAPLFVVCVDNTHELSWGFNEDKDSMILDGIWGNRSNPRNLAGVWMFRGVSSTFIRNYPAVLYSSPYRAIHLPPEIWKVSNVQEYMLTQREIDNFLDMGHPAPTGPDATAESQ